MKKIISFLLVIVGLFCLSSCQDTETLRFTAPEGTPALSILRLPVDNKTIGDYDVSYEIVSPSNIAAEMSAGKSDLVVLPVNAGASLIRQGADYKLVSVAVNGSLFLIGKQTSPLTLSSIQGKTVACIGKTGVPGLIFRYILQQNGIEIITEGEPSTTQVFVQYVTDATMARTFDYAVVGEPAATVFQSKFGFQSELNLQTEYKNCSGKDNYPQAGLFVKTKLSQNEKFMTELFTALQQNKDWIDKNPSSVNSFAQENLYQSASFPANALPRCALDCTVLSDKQKEEIISFLQNVCPKDTQGAINWTDYKDIIF